MNKIIPFNKVITLNERFDEIKKIALDAPLKLEDEYTIKGDLIIRGCYKVLDKEEDFNYPIPVEIAIDSKYNTSDCSINVDDFYYEIINEQSIRVKIDLLLDNLYYKEEENSKVELVLEDNRNNEFDELEQLEDYQEESSQELLSDSLLNNNDLLKVEQINNNLDDSNNKLEKIGNENQKSNLMNNNLDSNNNFTQITDLFNEKEENLEYSIYRVYVVSEGETLEHIMDKYKVTRDDLAPFNDLDNLYVGMKLIIPSIDE